MARIEVDILGSKYTMLGEDPAQIKSLARYVEGELKKIKEGKPNLSLYATAIVGSFNIANELFKCAHENDALHKEIESLKEGMSKPNEDVEAKIKDMNVQLNQMEIELMNKDSIIEDFDEKVKKQNEKLEGFNKKAEDKNLELEKYMAQINDLKEELEEAKKRVEVAEDIASQWQNKVYNSQLKYAQLEKQLKDKEETL